MHMRASTQTSIDILNKAKQMWCTLSMMKYPNNLINMLNWGLPWGVIGNALDLVWPNLIYFIQREVNSIAIGIT